MRHILTAALAASLTFAIAAPGHAAGFPACVDGLKRAAGKAGIRKSVVRRALDIAEPDARVLRLSTVQPERRIPIWDYLAFVVDDQRVREGKAAMRRHAAALRRAEKRFGVNRHVIAAIWGVETDYGKTAGRNFLPHALATLTCRGGRREAFWRRELLAALRIVDAGDLPLAKLYGSWAGAFGQTQFMPSTYRRLAVDFDGDGRKDLVSSVPDALGSAANYLRRAGWRTGVPRIIEVRVPGNYRGPEGRKRKASLDEWAARGAKRMDKRRLKGKLRAGLLRPAGADGPAFLTFRNFDALYAYNHAESYALAVAHLADRLAGRGRFRAAWPTDDPGLSRIERKRLQELLIAKGYNPGEPDGKIGPKSRAAIREAERDFGLPVTGRAARRIYRALGGK
ncbi:MAG: lytic murein transglycosylase [Rhodospirillaceae bacterium]|nr:lytic murein transglycosylase [Rhodospirillaceae bacterium]MDE0615955.1 lytic murein transglycosylase [Rhodospirillaceae bacterium]